MPTFDELLEQVLTLLQRDGRVAYRVLKRRFALSDDDLEDLKADLIDAKRVAVDEAGKVLVWVGEGAKEETGNRRIGESAKRPERLSSPQTLDARPQTLDFPRPEAERRQLTVMFCDLVDSTALSEQLDPEEWRTLVKEYQGGCAEIIRRFDGHIAQYLGAGLLAYFGYPVAHEDDAQRAAHAGLEITTTFRHRLSAGHAVPSPRGALINQGSTEGQGEEAKVSGIATLTPHPDSCASAQDRLPPQGGKENTREAQPLQVRIGIHTGLVVVGEIGEGNRREQLALGDTPNIAARLQGLAQPNTVVISAATHRLIAGLLDCQDLGSHSLKGVSTPLQIYQVVGESGARSRLDVALTTGLTPLVGREEEVGLLFKRWEQAKAGDGQVVMLNGEAGIGKSRLVQVLKEHLTPEVHAQVECRCSPYYQNSALYPVIDHLQRLLEFQREDSAEEKLRKLEVGARLRPGSSTCHVPLQPEAIPLLASLLSIPLPPHYPPLTGTPQRQKQKTLEALLVWLLKEAERQPVLKGELSLQSGVRGQATSGVRSPMADGPNPQHPTPSTQEEAEACFHQAIDIARQQQAKSLELRAVLSLARLWQQQGKTDKARQMLAEIYHWFTEGFDTKDLQEAKALLEELA
ncbi:MAG: AAA family ATPase [Deltaproteobacteria bacterium]|nr:AAA family ATPase [Deltaproteobacteria bacterium]